VVSAAPFLREESVRGPRRRMPAGGPVGRSAVVVVGAVARVTATDTKESQTMSPRSTIRSTSRIRRAEREPRYSRTGVTAVR
jgi:hypothetical protein